MSLLSRQTMSIVAQMTKTKNRLLGLIAQETSDQSVQGALDSLGVSLERGFTPAISSLVIADLDKQPTR